MEQFRYIQQYLILKCVIVFNEKQKYTIFYFIFLIEENEQKK